MIVNHSDETPIIFNNSIFLAGPTPRSECIPSWRPQAIQILKELGFEGVVYVPEHKEGTKEGYDYLKQVEWEYTCLENAGAICFWVPRQLPDMPAFTTNVEFGRYVGREGAFYGRPEWAEKKGYLDWLYEKLRNRKPSESMISLIEDAIFFLENR